MQDFWNKRYAETEFAYGALPNEFLKEQLQNLSAGKILFVCEGEGRNAVFAAKQYWNVEAFDLSAEGKKKALQLAEQNNVTINYQLIQYCFIFCDHIKFFLWVYNTAQPSFKFSFIHQVDSIF